MVRLSAPSKEKEVRVVRFKKATIDIRFSRESGQDHRGVFKMGETYPSRFIQELYPGMPVRINDGREYVIMEIHNWDNPIDGEILINGNMAYSFSIDGIVKNEYTSIRFYYSGFWYILEYRFLERENS